MAGCSFFVLKKFGFISLFSIINILYTYKRENTSENLEKEEFFMKFFERLQELRSENKYTQKELATILGISYQSLQKYEKGINKPRVIHLIKLASIFNVSVSYLIGESNKRHSSKTADPKVLSKRLKELRSESGYTQQELAELVGITGSGYSNYGSGKEQTLPRLDRLEMLADVFNVSISYLLGETDTRPSLGRNNPNTFPERLKLLRKTSGYTQGVLAQKLGLSSSQTYSNYERGVNKPTKETLNKLAEFFNVSVEYLLCETDERT